VGNRGYRTQTFIIDNGSCSTELRKLEKWAESHSSENINLVRNRHNLGFTAGMNIGIDAALGIDPEYLWLINKDTIINSDAPDRLINYMEANPDVVMAGATMVDPDGCTILCAGGYRYYKWIGWSHPVNRHTPLANLDTIDEPRFDYIDGAAMLLRANFIKRIGGLPGANYLYFEELTLNLYLTQNERVGWCRDAIVRHAVGGSSTTPRLKERSTYHASLSAFRYTKSNCPACLPTVIFARVLGISFRALVNRQPRLLGAVFRALKDLALDLPADPA
jgi:GT2 family glycosyltransferase